jgi:hypothetical protein
VPAGYPISEAEAQQIGEFCHTWRNYLAIGALGPDLFYLLPDYVNTRGCMIAGLLAQMGDWSELLTSGLSEAHGDDAFYWSRSNAQAQIAFAVSWMTHCVTDVAGHPFTNAKCGGPYRDRWQRHHLVENHFDSENYTATNTGPCDARGYAQGPVRPGLRRPAGPPDWRHARRDGRRPSAWPEDPDPGSAVFGQRRQR